MSHWNKLFTSTAGGQFTLAVLAGLFTVWLLYAGKRSHTLFKQKWAGDGTGHFVWTIFRKIALVGLGAILWLFFDYTRNEKGWFNNFLCAVNGYNFITLLKLLLLDVGLTTTSVKEAIDNIRSRFKRWVSPPAAPPDIDALIEHLDDSVYTDSSMASKQLYAYMRWVLLPLSLL